MKSLRREITEYNLKRSLRQSIDDIFSSRASPSARISRLLRLYEDSCRDLEASEVCHIIRCLEVLACTRRQGSRGGGRLYSTRDGESAYARTRKTRAGREERKTRVGRKKRSTKRRRDSAS